MKKTGRWRRERESHSLITSVLQGANKKELLSSAILLTKFHTDMAAIHSLDGVCLFVTDNCASFGWRPEDIIGKNFYDFIDQEDVFAVIKSHLSNLDKDAISCHYRMKCKDGHTRWVETKSRVYNNEKIISVTRDIHDLKSIQIHLVQENDKLERLTYTDELSGLPNFRAFKKIINPMIDGREPFALCLIDIDHFKKINDLHGHETGNFVIRDLGAVLVECTRKSDFVCRFGGEEFVLIFRDVTTDIAMKIAEDLRFTIESRKFGGLHITASIGIAISDGSFENGEDIVHAADKAMYHSKLSGRNQVTYYGSMSI